MNWRNAAIIALGTVLFVFIFGTLYQDIYEGLELRTYDLRAHLRLPVRHAEPEIVIVDVDDRSIAGLGDYARWPRQYHAQVISYLNPARVIGLYLPLLGTDSLRAGELGLFRTLKLPALETALKLPAARADSLVTTVLRAQTYDDELVSAMRASAKVCLAFLFDDRKRNDEKQPFIEYTVRKPKQVIERPDFRAPAAALTKAARGMGFAETFPDPDGTIRSQPLLVSCKRELYGCFALAVTKTFLGITRVEVTGPNSMSIGERNFVLDPDMRLRFLHPRRPMRYVSYIDVLQARVPQEDFRDKIVMVGCSDVAAARMEAVPFFPALHGLEEQGYVISGLITGDYIQGLWQGVPLVLTALLSFGLAYVVLRFRFLYGGIAALVLIACYLAIAYVLFVENHVWLEVLRPLLGMVLVTGVGIGYKYTTELRNRHAARTLLGRHLPPDQAHRLSYQPRFLRPAAQLIECAFVWCEVKDLEPAWVRLGMSDLSGICQEFEESMAPAVYAAGGAVDRRIARGFTAVFGAFTPDPDPALAAARCAVDLRRRFSLLGARWQGENKGALELGIAISHGHALFHPCGRDEGRDLRITGPAFDDAQQLALVVRTVKPTILVTARVAELLGARARLREHGSSSVAGTELPILELLRLES